jgi:hypothetical protein
MKYGATIPAPYGYHMQRPLPILQRPIPLPPRANIFITYPYNLTAGLTP